MGPPLNFQHGPGRPRSLSLVDYALRRRFAFATLRPRFDHPRFRAHLEARGVPSERVDEIIERMNELNAVIRSDRKHLGEGFEIGHSFFCDPSPDHERWYTHVVRYEIEPLLQEYWFDDPEKARERVEALLRR